MSAPPAVLVLLGMCFRYYDCINAHVIGSLMSDLLPRLIYCCYACVDVHVRSLIAILPLRLFCRRRYAFSRHQQLLAPCRAAVQDPLLLLLLRSFLRSCLLADTVLLLKSRDVLLMLHSRRRPCPFARCLSAA